MSSKSQRSSARRALLALTVLSLALAGLLAGAGYRLVSSAVVDLFGHTGQVEAVSTFVRDTDPPS